jgi:hypothetical protein
VGRDLDAVVLGEPVGGGGIGQVGQGDPAGFEVLVEGVGLGER